MARVVGIGKQDFEKVISEQCFYIDKTAFIKEWWENQDDVTLITRPRRFGKTLNMSMLEKFFSVRYAGRGELFEGLSIWKEEGLLLLNLLILQSLRFVQTTVLQQCVNLWLTTTEVDVHGHTVVDTTRS